MGKRRQGREMALCCLYALEMQPGGDPEERLKEIKISGADKTAFNFALKLVRGVLENKLRLDDLLENSVVNWPFKRVAVIDRNLLRLALYEALDSGGKTSAAVFIDEAIELAKIYGTEESYRFINGILNKIKEDLESGKTAYLQKDR